VFQRSRSDKQDAADYIPDNGNSAASGRIEAAVLTIARLIGRQMAREAFERLKAANDNDPAERRED
jgi:hypothetical protein